MCASLKVMIKTVIRDIFLKQMLNTQQICLIFIRIFHFYLKERKSKNLVCNIHDKEDHVVHTEALKQALNQGLILKKVYRVIQFNHEARLKPYIDMNTKLRKEAKN